MLLRESQSQCNGCTRLRAFGGAAHREVEHFTGNAAGAHEEAMLVVHANQPAIAVYVLQGGAGIAIRAQKCALEA